MNIYFVRHGETEQNAKKTYYGSLDVNLNEKGVAQALKLKGKLQNIKFDKVFVSERLRAVETCNYIIGEAKQQPVVDERINEMNFGVFEGKTYEELCAAYPEEVKAWQKDWKEFCPQEGESYVMFYEKVKNFMEYLLTLEAANVLVVTHGGVIRTMYCYILGENLDFYWKFASKNGDISLIKYKHGDLFIDSISHI